MSQQPRSAVIRDVARLAGVSHQTVSRVMNNHPSVRPETRDRVMRAVHQLNFRPNANARGLANRRSRLIGVISFEPLLFGPASTLLGIERAARTAGYSVSVVALEQLDHDAVADALDRLTAQAVAGVAVIAPLLSVFEATRTLMAAGPAVVVEPDAEADLPTVAVDQVAGAQLAVGHLLDLGHETVWHLSGPQAWSQARSREDGWRQALQAAGRRVPPVLVGDWSPRSGYEVGLDLAERPDVSAVFCANDHQALGLLRALHERRVRVPEDISVVGFDDIPESRYLSPPLTTVRQDFDEVGRRCLGTLLELIETGSVTETSRHPRVQPTLVVRASSSPPSRVALSR
ncbi:LacI family DNA-binding transcriptional regulator [Catellatospora tritici]|uniref:LacI family DNA-binding transcriptional regulator n=1 Tax=Catellatospora tritici TaxID=2851566 RepID=UPI001C2CEFB1|nr:LacI family DNA-binding transcriptional regulator [Catellatospora tritici]MBV1856722.1 LacI family DNA-binding transcriptional regulator [Catellatospora tritici]